MPALGGCDYYGYKDWMEKGKDFYSKGAMDLALNCFDKAIEKLSSCTLIGEKRYDERAEAYNWKGRTLFELGRYKDAIDAYDNALSNKKSDWTWRNKGRALYNLKRYGEALNAYNEALAINPVDKIAWFNKGVVYLVS
jgi:tetratricopeptide (TPR) repeat protein